MWLNCPFLVVVLVGHKGLDDGTEISEANANIPRADQPF